MISTDCLSSIVDVIKKNKKDYDEKYIHSILVNINAKLCNNIYGVDISKYKNRVHGYIKTNYSDTETGLYVASFVMMIDRWLDVDNLSNDEYIIYRRMYLIYSRFMENKHYNKECLFFKPIKYHRNESVTEFKNQICINYYKNKNNY